jgi:dTMP kinase
VLTNLCGLDAAGKASQVNRLSKALPLILNQTVETYDFPHYETISGQAIRRILTNDIEINVSIRSIVIQSLMTINRLEYVPTLTRAAGSTEYHLILDRYAVCSLAYGVADGLPLEYLENIHSTLPKPDISILIDISPEASVSRRANRRDEYETRPGFLHKVRANYLDLFSNYAESDGHSKWIIVDGEQDEDTVHKNIINAVTATCFPVTNT